jgi:hypothetical protein
MRVGMGVKGLLPSKELEEAKVDIISLKTGEIWGWNHEDWGEPVARSMRSASTTMTPSSFRVDRSTLICCAPIRTPARW